MPHWLFEQNAHILTKAQGFLLKENLCCTTVISSPVYPINLGNHILTESVLFKVTS